MASDIAKATPDREEEKNKKDIHRSDAEVPLSL
jgi:hypothetical protein